MRICPLIYSRTKKCDYTPGFLVRPYDIDFNMAAKYVGQALEDVKHAGGIKHAVFSVGEYLIYGGIASVSQILEDIIKHERQINELDFDCKEYQSDKEGRPITFFIGFGIKRSDIVAHKIPNIDLYFIYKTYLEFLKEQWDAPITKTKIIYYEHFIEVDVSPITEVFHPEVIEFNGKCFLKNYDENKYKAVVDHYFNNMVLNNHADYSFLSNVITYGEENCTLFKTISIYGQSPESYIKNCKSVTKQDKGIDELPVHETYVPPLIHSTDDPKEDGSKIYHSGLEYAKDHNNFFNKKKEVLRLRAFSIATILVMGLIIMVMFLLLKN